MTAGEAVQAVVARRAAEPRKVVVGNNLDAGGWHAGSMSSG